jgi:hypothetical protein
MMAGVFCVGLAFYPVLMHGWTVKYAVLIGMASFLAWGAKLSDGLKSNVGLLMLSVARACHVQNFLLAVIDITEFWGSCDARDVFVSGGGARKPLKGGHKACVQFESRSRDEVIPGLLK